MASQLKTAKENGSGLYSRYVFTLGALKGEVVHIDWDNANLNDYFISTLVNPKAIFLNASTYTNVNSFKVLGNLSGKKVTITTNVSEEDIVVVVLGY